MTLLRIMSSVTPPLSRAIWSSWHMLRNEEIFLVIRMIRLIARSVRLITDIKLFGSEENGCRQRKKKVDNI